MRMRQHARHLLMPTAALLAGALVISGCKSEPGDTTKNGDGDGKTAVVIEFPDGDPSVSAELGGPGFTGEGWQTASPGPLGDPRAVKGGAIQSNIPNWPENLRAYGTGSNTYLNSIVESLCYEALLGRHPETLEFIPELASHWKISDDNMTFQFRINPKAHWTDGKPVVAEDWAATYRLIADDTLLDPMNKLTLVDKMHEPKVISKYMLEVKCKEKSWRNFPAVSSIYPLPAHEIDGLTGTEFLKKFNFSYTSTTGPYHVRSSDIKDNESLTVSRRDDYWAADDPVNQGYYNFDKIRFVVVRDRRLAFEKVLKGELDFLAVYTSKWWMEDVDPTPAVQKGHLVKQKIFTNFPQGVQGMAFNMRRPPLDDVNVRRALSLLYDRKKMLTKFAYDQYDRLKSYYPNGDAENPDNVMVDYDPAEAIRLLADSGWSERGGDGILIKDGERLSFEIMYRTSGFEKYLTSFQEDCRNAGVEITLKLVTPESHWKAMMERSFQIAGMSWAAILFPNPKSNWGSVAADKEGSNNITGFHSEKADALIEQYDSEFDLQKRFALLRELDAEIYRHHPYSLEWFNPSDWVLYWNKFGVPERGLPKYGDWRDVFSTWWIDPEKAEALKKAIKAGTPLEPKPTYILRGWDDSESGAGS